MHTTRRSGSSEDTHEEWEKELISAAYSNLKGYNYQRFLELMEGDYKGDEDALRGFIWSHAEDDT